MASVNETLETLASALEARFPDLGRVPSHCGELTRELTSDKLIETAAALRDEAPFDFEQLIDVCVVDYLAYGKDEWSTEAATATGFTRGVTRHVPESHPGAPRRFAVVYHLLSVSRNRRLRLKTWCADDDYPVVAVGERHLAGGKLV